MEISEEVSTSEAGSDGRFSVEVETGISGATARVSHLIAAFNGLTAFEQRVVANRLFEIMSAGMPPAPFLVTMKVEADCWARLAMPGELRIYLSAIVRHMTPADIRSAFVYLWERFPEQDRRAFVRKVDPDGRFTRGRK